MGKKSDTLNIMIDDISDEEVENYLKIGNCLSICGGISINNALFVHLKEGRMSTARGMTIEYAKEMMANLN